MLIRAADTAVEFFLLLVAFLIALLASATAVKFVLHQPVSVAALIFALALGHALANSVLYLKG